jgi:hypothetical protein
MSDPRKATLEPQEIMEAQAKALETCALIACEHDFDPACTRGGCHPAFCPVIQFEAARLCLLHELEHPAIAYRPGRGGRPGVPHHIGPRDPNKPLSAASVTTPLDWEKMFARHAMRFFEQGDGFYSVRKGTRMRHLGNGGYMAVKKYS